MASGVHPCELEAPFDTMGVCTHLCEACSARGRLGSPPGHPCRLEELGVEGEKHSPWAGGVRSPLHGKSAALAAFLSCRNLPAPSLGSPKTVNHPEWALPEWAAHSMGSPMDANLKESAQLAQELPDQPDWAAVPQLAASA